MDRERENAMEREKEIARLVNVLRQTSRMAMQSEWTGGSQDAAAHCVEQFNRVLKRLADFEPDVATVFEPLPPGSSLTVAAMACRQVGAYFEEDGGRGRSWGRGHAFAFNTGPFKEFWRESAKDIEDFGEFIRESVDEWARRRGRGPGCDAPPPPHEEKPPSAG
jgi:hypothetical protein